MQRPQHAAAEVGDPGLRIDRRPGLVDGDRDRVDAEVAPGEILSEVCRPDLGQRPRIGIGLRTSAGDIDLEPVAAHGRGREALVAAQLAPERLRER